MQNLMMIYLKIILHRLNCLESLKPITIDGTVSYCSIIPTVYTRYLSSMKDIYSARILFSLQSHTEEHLILHPLI